MEKYKNVFDKKGNWKSLKKTPMAKKRKSKRKKSYSKSFVSTYSPSIGVSSETKSVGLIFLFFIGYLFLKDGWNNLFNPAASTKADIDKNVIKMTITESQASEAANLLYQNLNAYFSTEFNFIFSTLSNKNVYDLNAIAYYYKANQFLVQIIRPTSLSEDLRSELDVSQIAKLKPIVSGSDILL
jgi:hypothetical protein